MKKYLFLTAATALALASCSSDDYVGGEDLASTDAITFGSKTAAVTRADVGAAAATKLGNEFVVFGWKSYDPKQTVYDHYTVKFADGTANSTTSNTAGWEYVNQPLNMLTSLTGSPEQSIKYWDYTATSYDFIAFSLGTATQVATDKAIGEYVDGDVAISKVSTTPQYTITGKLADIAKVYIADRVTAQNITTGKVDNRLIGYKDPVQFNFHAATSKVRMGIYETIPGYSVKDVKFYAMGATEPALLAVGDQAPTLFGSAATIANSTSVVTATVTFPNTTSTSPDYNKAVLTLPDGAKSKNMTFGTLSYVDKEHKEAAGQYIGRASNTASLCEYVNVFPCTPGELTLKVDYTLVSRDGSGETIDVKGATATVPAQYGDWKPNFAYTYLFKISDNTNGTTGGNTDPAGLYPITFDAIVTADEEGNQETITSVATPSITTYAKGVNPTVAATAEYPTGVAIYVSVDGETLVSTPTPNFALFTATQAKVSGTLEPAQGITEESVANAIAHDQDGTPGAPYVVTDANNWSLTVAAATAPTIVTEIAAGDAPAGKAVPGNFAKFTPSAAGNYVFEFTKAGEKYYKVIKVVAAP